MGVYIKGMEMPEICFDCPLYHLQCNSCRVQNEKMVEALSRDPDCPIIPIPTLHGRIIDADTLIIPDDICDGYEVREIIKNAPTVIPAEEGT